jgi:hypothetical protein
VPKLLILWRLYDIDLFLQEFRAALGHVPWSDMKRQLYACRTGHIQSIIPTKPRPPGSQRQCN